MSHDNVDALGECRPMSRSMLRRWRPRIERRTVTSLWGQRHVVIPCLVPFTWGDGRKWMWLEPLNTRPRYYVIRVDSRVNTSNWDTEPTFIETTLDSVLNEIGDLFGSAMSEGRIAKWPELDWSYGGAWGAYEPPKAS